jgi:hypothetical protein
LNDSVSAQPSPINPEPTSPEELERRRVADAHGDPYLLYRDAGGALQVLSLPGSWEQVHIGRSMAAEISLQWDPEVSTVHAQLERVGDDWVLVDDGLSRNGSFINDERMKGRRRLYDGDTLRFGRTPVRFHAPLQVHERTLMRPDGGDEG